MPSEKTKGVMISKLLQSSHEASKKVTRNIHTERSGKESVRETEIRSSDNEEDETPEMEKSIDRRFNSLSKS